MNSILSWSSLPYILQKQEVLKYPFILKWNNNFLWYIQVHSTNEKWVYIRINNAEDLKGPWHNKEAAISHPVFYNKDMSLKILMIHIRMQHPNTFTNTTLEQPWVWGLIFGANNPLNLCHYVWSQSVYHYHPMGIVSIFLIMSIPRGRGARIRAVVHKYEYTILQTFNKIANNSNI